MSEKKQKLELSDGTLINLKDPSKIYELTEPGIKLSLVYRGGEIYSGLLKQLNIIEDEITLEKEDSNIEPIVLPLDGSFIGWFITKED